ncbi:MAG: TolC family protein, partial [Sphingopyxis sp.]|nr:TolC family protein [Sphingopyxis sp.]
MNRALWLCIAAAPLLGGCATARYTSPPTASSVAAPASFAYARNAPAADQSRIAALLPTQDAGFVALSERASANAPTLAAALARIDAARALAARARSEQRPSVSANADISGNRTSATQIGANLPPGISLNTDRISFGGQMSARWDADIFGRLRSESRAAALRVDAATAD